MRIDIDVTKAGLVPSGDYIATIIKYEIKDTKDNTGKYVNWQLHIPGKGNIFHMTSLKDGKLLGLKFFLDAAGIAYNKDGFELDGAINKQVSIRVVEEDDPTYGAQNRITRVWKA